MAATSTGAGMVVHGLKEVHAAARKVDSNLRYAISLAVNDTALELQGFSINQLLPSALTLRSKGGPWQKKGGRFGINIRPFANKLTLSATVGSQAPWLKHVEEGGTKTADKSLAIPTSEYKSKRELMAAHKKPRAILAGAVKRQISDSERDQSKSGKRKTQRLQRQLKAIAGLTAPAFIYRGDAMPHGIYARRGQEQLPLRALFIFKRSAHVPAILHFFKRNKEKVDAIYQKRFAIRFAQLLVPFK